MSIALHSGAFMFILAIFLAIAFVGDARICEKKQDIEGAKKKECDKAKCYKVECKEQVGFKYKREDCGDCGDFMKEHGFNMKIMEDMNCKCEDSKDSECDWKVDVKVDRQPCGRKVTKCYLTECPKGDLINKFKDNGCDTCAKYKAKAGHDIFNALNCACTETDSAGGDPFDAGRDDTTDAPRDEPSTDTTKKSADTTKKSADTTKEPVKDAASSAALSKWGFFIGVMATIVFAFCPIGCMMVKF